MRSCYIAMVLLPILPVAQAFAESFDGGGDRREMFRQKMQDKMNEMDTNGDGIISKYEFMAQSEERFNKLDANGDGNITKDEREAMTNKFKERKGGGARGKAFP